MAQAQGLRCHPLAVDYGQRHRSELQAAQRVATAAGTLLKVLNLDLRAIGGSALTDDIAVPEEATEGIPVTYVPARNTVLLSMALAWAETLDAADIFIGANAVDYSGYPDCRPAFIEAFVQDFPWAHLDIAGTAWSDKDRPYVPKGGTGVGVRLLVDWLRSRQS